MSIDEEPITPIDWDKPIETTEGLPARLISALPARLLSTDYRVGEKSFMVVQIEHPSGSQARIFHENGIPYLAYPGKIRNRKTKREGWINIFPDQWVGCSHGSEEAARRHPNAKGAIATIKIEWEE
jgi:hypothetical protein